MSVRVRWMGAILGIVAVAFTYGCARLPFGWWGAGLVLSLFGWLMGGYVRHLRRMAERDELTGVHNRRSLDRTLRKEWERSVRCGTPLSLLFLDVDDFGAVNKRFGHLTGDEALRVISRIIRQSLRNTDMVARWGGEEFVVLAPNTDLLAAAIVAERIRCVVEYAPIRDRDRYFSLTVSVGVASFPGASQTPLELMHEAIEGQRAAKMQKNTVQVIS